MASTDAANLDNTGCEHRPRALIPARFYSYALAPKLAGAAACRGRWHFLALITAAKQTQQEKRANGTDPVLAEINREREVMRAAAQQMLPAGCSPIEGNYADAIAPAG